MKNAGRLNWGLLLVLCGLGPAVAAGAAFDLEQTGARSLGLAGAFCGLADDADAVFYNPAGLAQNQSVLISLGRSQLLNGLEDGRLAENRLAYVQPLRRLGSLGLAWHQLDLSGVYQENLFSLDYAAALEPSRRSFFGGGLRILNVSYHSEVTDGNDFFAEAASRTGVTLDLGGLVFLGKNFSLGAGLFNVLPARVALKPDADSMPLQVRAGLGYRGSAQAAAVDVLAYAGKYRAAVGGEWWWFQRTIATRAGIGCGDSGLLESSAGLSLNLKFGGWGGQLDYAYQVPWGEASGLGSSHHLNLTFILEPNTPETVSGRKYVPAAPSPAGAGLFRPLKAAAGAAPAPEDEAPAVREQEKAASKNEVLPARQRPEPDSTSAGRAESAAGGEKDYKPQRAAQEPPVKPDHAGPAAKEKRTAVLSGPAVFKPAAAASGPPARAADIPAGDKPPANPAAGVQAAASPAAPNAGRLRKRARGAYGRAVKLMLEIDDMSGSTFFPREYAALQKEMQALKLLLKSEDYQKIIENAKKIFPKLEKLKRRSAERKMKRESMPTHW